MPSDVISDGIGTVLPYWFWGALCGLVSVLVLFGDFDSLSVNRKADRAWSKGHRFESCPGPYFREIFKTGAVMSAIDFYFDFSSPYGYIASLLIDDLAAVHGREVNWKPFLLGYAMQKTGGAPLIDVPMKSDYLWHDVQRSASEHGARFRLAPGFPFNSMPAVRAYYWLYDQNAEQAKALAQTLYHAGYAEERSIVSPEDVASIAEEKLGIQSTETLAAMQNPEVKSRVKGVVSEAMEREVFGSPFFIVDGERFWGPSPAAN